MDKIIQKDSYVPPIGEIVIMRQIILSGSLIPPGENTEWEDEG